MKKKVALPFLAIVLIGVITSHISFKPADHSHLMIVDGIEIDVLGKIQNQWLFQTQNCEGAFEQRVHLATCFVQAPQGGDGALTRATSLIAVGLYQLHVGVATRSGELGENEGYCSRALQRMQLLLPTLKSNKIASTRNSVRQC